MADNRIDIDGGIGTMFVIASKGRREMPDGDVYLDGGLEMLSREGSFVGQHICTPLHGVAVHINAFNFPVWGMLEKLAPTLLAGMPAIVKPATASGYVAEAAVRIMLESGILPEGALQLVSGDLGDLLDRLDGQDVVSFTGSAATALTLAIPPSASRRGGALRGRTGQPERHDPRARCRAGDAGIRPVPEGSTSGDDGQGGSEMHRDPAHPRARATGGGGDRGLSERLAKTRIGAPERETTRMGALISQAQRQDVLAQAAKIGAEAERVLAIPTPSTSTARTRRRGLPATDALPLRKARPHGAHP
jgi:oxepin-CoA hydrolase/3-oxo-5,6-dehydrosuberyl-CoA semialdehyde dehydrogenase